MDSISELTPKENQHIKLMSDIAKMFVDTPMILKGGTALLLAYGLDRFSEDLDFDSYKFLRLENKIKDAIKYPVTLQSLDLLKDTDTVTRYRLVYNTPLSQSNRLKIEVSHRVQEAPDKMSYEIINGIKVYKLPTLIRQKLLALENRTTARDLYDVNFLVKNHKDSFLKENWVKLKLILSDLDSLEKRFTPAFEIDEILSTKDVSSILLNLNEATSALNKKHSNGIKI